METKEFYRIMADALLKRTETINGHNEYADLKSIAIGCLNDSNIDISLIDETCITTRLIFPECSVADLPREIDEKSKTGQNEAKSSAKKAAKINDAIKDLKKPFAENLTNLIEENDYITNRDLKDLLCNIIRVNKDKELLSSIFATAVVSKINSTGIDKINTSKEFEYELEPIIKALIVNKKVNKDISLYDTDKKHPTSIQMEVAAIVSGVLGEKTANTFFHDLATTYHLITTITGKNSDWDVSLADKKSRMWWIDSTGKQRKLFFYQDADKKTQFLKGMDSITELITLGDSNTTAGMGESGIFTAFKQLQAQITGKELNDEGDIDSRFANADNLLQLLATTVFLCDAMEVNSVAAKKMRFAIMNPLTDILETLTVKNGSAYVDNIINSALKRAQAILEIEQDGKEYRKDQEIGKAASTVAATAATVTTHTTSAPVMKKTVAAPKDPETLKQNAIVKNNKAYRKATRMILVNTFSLVDIYNTVADIDLGENTKLVRAIKSIINYYIVKTKGLEKNIDGGDLEKLTKKLDTRKNNIELKKQISWLTEDEADTAIATAKQILADIASLQEDNITKKTIDDMATTAANRILTTNVGKFAKKTTGEESED